MSLKNELRVKLLQKNYDIMIRIPYRYINIGRNNKLRCIIACFIIFVVGYLTINLLQNFPLSKSERERHLPIETPPGQKIYQDDQLKKSKLTTENKLEDGIPDIPISSKSTSIGTTSLPTTAHNEPITEHRTKATTSQLQTKTKTLENISPSPNQNSSNKVQEIENLEAASKNDPPVKQKLMVDEYHTVMVPDQIKGPFTVAKHFWELATENTKNIFDIVPPSFLPNMKNPCFWEDYKLNGDPYADSPYAPQIGKTIQYDPWGHTAYYKKARDRFNAHLIRGEDGNTKRLRCLPYFYLISTPKSGTTTLWNQLSKHEEINMRIGIKENAWWNFMRNGLQGEHHWVYHLVPPLKSYIPNKEYLQSIDQFLDLFDNEAMNFYDLSLSQSYVSNVTALAPINMLTAPMDFWDILNPSLPPQGFDSPPNILHPAYIISKVQPGAKFVAILRNPTDRLYSDWEFFNKAHDREKFHGLVVAALNDFNKCLSLYTRRKCLYDWKLIQRSLRLNRGTYAPFLKDLFEVFPRDQVLVLPFDYFTTEQFEATNKILDFLNITQITDSKKILKKAYYDRWFIPAEDRIMLPETQNLLDEFYSPFNIELAELMDDQRFLFERVERATEADEETVIEKEPSVEVKEGQVHDHNSKVRKTRTESRKTIKENDSENENKNS